MSTNDNSLDFGDIVTDIENLDAETTNLEENFEQLVQNVVFGDGLPAGRKTSRRSTLCRRSKLTGSSLSFSMVSKFRFKIISTR